MFIFILFSLRHLCCENKSQVLVPEGCSSWYFDLWLSSVYCYESLDECTSVLVLEFIAIWIWKCGT